MAIFTIYRQIYIEILFNVSVKISENVVNPMTIINSIY